MPKTKSLQRIREEIHATMIQRHGRTYVYKEYSRYGSDMGYWSHIPISITAQYRHGEIVVDCILTQDEIRNERLNELGI